MHVAIDAFPAAPFEVQWLPAVRWLRSSSVGSDEVLLSTECRILRLQIANQIECVENFMTHWHLFSIEEIIFNLYYTIYFNNIQEKN